MTTRSSSLSSSSVAVLAATLLAGCGGFGGADDCEDDPAARHHAMNPTTGECWEFYSSCKVPPEWPDCDTIDPTPDAPPDMTPDASLPWPDGGMRPDGGTTSAECFTTADCGTGELCPAELGYCSFLFVPDPVPPACMSKCEPACFGDWDCVDGTRCNVYDLAPACPIPHYKPHERSADSDALIACAGWCVPI